MQAYGLWAAWSARSLSEDLVEAFATDCALSTDMPLRSWEDTVVSGPEEAAEGGEEVRFALPAAPSPAAMALALGACAEVDRAGGHLLEEAPLRLLKWELGGSILGALRSALDEEGPLNQRVSEKGLLQLLFDIRFLVDSTAGGLPASAR